MRKGCNCKHGGGDDMIKVGSVAVKLAGRDAGQICAVVDVIDENFVLLDGNTRRRKCNLKHLQFLGREINVKKNANRDDVINELKTTGLKFEEQKKGEKRTKKTSEERNKNSEMRNANKTEKTKKKVDDKNLEKK